MQTLQQWKSRICLTSVLEGSQDLRTVDAMTRQIPKVAKIDPSQSQIMNNFHKEILICKDLATKPLDTFSSDDLQKMLTVVVDTGCKVPQKLQDQLLAATMRRHLAEMNYKKLLDCLSPFNDTAFDLHKPSLGGMELSQKEKCRLPCP
eukprot:5716904-Amphidinium_carterae.5